MRLEDEREEFDLEALAHVGVVAVLGGFAGRGAAQGAAGSGGYVGACGWVAPTNVEGEHAQWEGDHHVWFDSRGLLVLSCFNRRGAQASLEAELVQEVADFVVL